MKDKREYINFFDYMKKYNAEKFKVNTETVDLFDSKGIHIKKIFIGMKYLDEISYKNIIDSKESNNENEWLVLENGINKKDWLWKGGKFMDADNL